MVEPNKTTVSDNTENGAHNMVRLIIDNCEVVVPEHTTILDAAKSAGIQIPTLCYLRDLNEIGGCRVCVVEVEGCDQLVAACNNYVLDGMVVHTNSPKAREAVAPTCSCCFRSTIRNARAACAAATATYRPSPTTWAFSICRIKGIWRARAGISIFPSSAKTTSALNACAASKCVRACRAWGFGT